ncbi:hypothetical protein [Kribbella sancticallisti]|uniref:hypothetical protein n=1 Tax=Kribbella sancticallisti TaxID=460087 RepID=UPI0031CDB250
MSGVLYNSRVTWANLITGFLGDIAWPAVLVVVVVILRRELRALLARVTKVVTPIGSLDTEAQAIATKATDVETETLDRLAAKASTAADTDDEQDDGNGGQTYVNPEPIEFSSRSEQLDPWHASVDRDSEVGVLRELAEYQRLDATLPPAYEEALEVAERLVPVDPGEACDQAWKAFHGMVYDATSRLKSRGLDSTLVRLAKIDFPGDGLEIVKSLSDMNYSSGSLSSAGAKNYVDTVRIMAGLLFRLTISQESSTG